ncbi:hypothetical protein E2C01_094277 [Portunus trituberculatus]|uniref:Uncharacterized protein n=1 Tax=Portunus trituberculatus TaxID=210409 RepID=A0A5B7JLG0_PORTR|nr:hypothetical protein [Portunus trituberculatus]
MEEERKEKRSMAAPRVTKKQRGLGSSGAGRAPPHTPLSHLYEYWPVTIKSSSELMFTLAGPE